jgi:hypothetical protein
MPRDYPIDFAGCRQINRSPMVSAHRASHIRNVAATGLALLASLAAGATSALAAGSVESRQAFAQIRPVVERSVVMVKVAAFPQVRVKGVIQPPRQFDLEGPATVVAPGIIASSLAIFDPVKGFPPREGVEFSTTVFSKVEILVDGAEWIEGRMAAMSDGDDLIFFAPAKPEDASRLSALPSLADPRVEVFAEYLDVTRAPAAFGHTAVSRVSAITGYMPSGDFIFVTTQSTGSPLVDAQGAWLGLGVRVSSPGMPATSAVMPAARVLAIAKSKGVLAEAPAP